MAGEDVVLGGGDQSDVTAALEKLLYGNQPAEPAPSEDQDEPAAPEPQPKPAPVQEPDQDDEDDGPAPEPSAEVEGDVLQTSEPDKPDVAVREAPKPAPEAPKPQPEADQLLQQLSTLVPQLQASIAVQFGDIKTFEDLQRVASENPARYNQFVVSQAQLQHAHGKLQELQGAAQLRWYQAEQAKLAQALPEIADPQKGLALRTELREYAKKQGYSDQQIALASAQDVLTLHRAMQFDKWQAGEKARAAKLAAEQAKAKEKAAKAPPVSKPGVASDDKKQSKAEEKFQTFRKSGKPEDLAALLQESGIA